MRKFAIYKNSWLNWSMKDININIKDKIISRYLAKNTLKNPAKSTNINILLNRIKINKKNENRKKLYFSAVASTGLILFGLIIF